MQCEYLEQGRKLVVQCHPGVCALVTSRGREKPGFLLCPAVGSMVKTSWWFARCDGEGSTVSPSDKHRVNCAFSGTKYNPHNYSKYVPTLLMYQLHSATLPQVFHFSDTVKQTEFYSQNNYEQIHKHIELWQH